MISKILKGKHTSLWIILILAGINGLVYVFMVPPWQHYDEPSHFEHAWLIANRLSLPETGDYDQEMHRQVAKSMIEHGFFRGMGWQPDLTVQNQPIWIADYTQLDEPPLQYVLAAIPLTLLKSQDITLQLYTTRLVSWLLYLASIMAGYGLMSELTSPGNSLRWFLPLGMAFLPGYVDLMTSMNNDVVAAAMFSLFLWGAIFMIRRGISLGSLLWTGLSAALCFIAKESVYAAVPLFGVVLTFATLRRGLWRKIAWLGLAGGILAACGAILSWGDAVLWFRDIDQTAPTRLQHAQAPLGGSVIQLQVLPADYPGDQFQLYQLLPSESILPLRGKTVTLGAWIWADTPCQASAPLAAVWLNDRSVQYFTEQIEVGTEPAFYAFTVVLPENTAGVHFVLSSRVFETGSIGADRYIYYDGLVLAEGNYPVGETPLWNDAAARSGSWGGQPVVNLVRNASAEDAGPRVRPWVDRLGVRYLPDNGRPSLLLYSLLDWKGSGWYYVTTMINMHHTFWGKFGWGHVPLIGYHPYLALGVVTLLGILGCAFVFRHKDSKWRWDILVVLGLALVIVWGMTIVRGTFYLIYWPFIPGARYAYPVMAPTLGILLLGWQGIEEFLRTRLRLPTWIGFLVFGLGFLSLNILGIASILSYYLPSS